MEKYILPKDFPFFTLIIYRSRFIVIINKSTGVYPQTVFQSDKACHTGTRTHAHTLTYKSSIEEEMTSL